MNNLKGYFDYIDMQGGSMCLKASSDKGSSFSFTLPNVSLRLFNAAIRDEARNPILDTRIYNT